MLLTPELLNSNMSQNEIDILVNNLVVSFKDFASISSLNGRAYGVRTACDVKSDLVNACGRQQIFKHLIDAHQTAEDMLGYDLTPRYHYEKVSYNSTRNVKLQRPGFAGFYQQTFSASVMGQQAINPILINNVPLIDSGKGYAIAQLDSSLVDNPEKIMLVDASSGHQYNYQNIYGYPALTGGYWEVALLLLADNIASVTVHAFHCELVRVDIPDETLTTGQTLVPVYPDTNQIIPYAKAPEPLSPSGQRLWFYAYTLIDPAFGVDEVDLRGGVLQYYKLLNNVDIKIIEDVEILPVLTYRQDPQCVVGTTTNDSPTFTNITIESYKEINAKSSQLEFFPDTSTALTQDAGAPVEYLVYYKTDPAVLGKERNYTTIQEAVAHKAAAELPLKACGCPMDSDGFINIAQQSYDQIRISLSGEKVHNYQHNKLFGQEVFRTKLESLRGVPKVIEL